MGEFYGSFLHVITSWQYELNRSVASGLRELDGENSIYAIGTIMAISFMYGVIHAAGPGHGKALVGFYFIKRGGSYLKAFRLGYLISIIHAVSALILTFGIYYIIQTMFSRTFHDISHISMKISAVMIILVGLYLIYEAYKERNEKDTLEEQEDNRSDLSIAFSAGIVPCPGVMTITLFSITLGHFAVGILSAIVMSIGMGLTISLAGVLSVAISKRGDSVLSKYGYILQFIGASLVLILGLFLAVSAFSKV